MQIEFPNTDVASVPDMESILKHIDTNLSVLQNKVLQSDYSDPAQRMKFKEDVAWLRRYYDRAERLLLS